MVSSIEPSTTLPATASLFQRLNEAGIRYCHWKSTCRLPDALAGRTDFDILVDRSHSRQFIQILHEQDFKPFRSHPRRQYPAIEDYLGFDPQTGRLIHLHIHYRMILGEEYLKNYWLPLEQQFLDDVRPCHGIKVPAPALEVVVLALRTMLKYRDRDLLRDLRGRGQAGGIPASSLAELQELLAQTTPEEVERAAQRCAEIVAPELVLKLLRTLQQSPRDGRRLYRLRREVHRALKPYQRRRRLQASLYYYRIALSQLPPLQRVLRRLGLARKKQKIPVSGGVMLAFIGADGAGKSTLIRHMARWLSWRVVVHSHYMGTSHPSLMTRALKHIDRVAQIATSGSRRLLGARNPLTRGLDSVRQTIESLRLLSEGGDRYRRYLAGRNAAGQGAVVLYDRFPLSEVRLANRTMDGPRIATKLSGRASPLIAGLAGIEQQLYQKMRPPEHIFILHVSPEVSQRRKPSHQRETIEMKSQALSHLLERDSQRSSLIHINADEPFEQVLLSVKSAVWRLL